MGVDLHEFAQSHILELAITSVLTSLGLFNFLPLTFKSKKSRRHNHTQKKKKKPAPNLAKSPMGIES